jgi:hypothetical protein
MWNITYQPLRKCKSCNKAKRLLIAPPYFNDPEYSMAASLLYSQYLKIFPYNRIEKQLQGGCFEPNSSVKALMHDQAYLLCNKNIDFHHTTAIGR